jgi:IS30 family transposase
MVARGRDRGLFHGGVKHWNARLTDEQVASIRQAQASGESQHSIAKRFGVHQSTVSRIVRGVRRAGRG